jgi:hypothetical protein
MITLLRRLFSVIKFEFIHSGRVVICKLGKNNLQPERNAVVVVVVLEQWEMMVVVGCC